MKNILKSKKIWTVIIIILCIIIYFIFNKNKQEKIYLKDYSYVEVQKSDNVGEITLNGQIMANNPIGIFVDKKLKVKEVFVKNGDYVEKGKTLITFDDK